METRRFKTFNLTTVSIYNFGARANLITQGMVAMTIYENPVCAGYEIPVSKFGHQRGSQK